MSKVTLNSIGSRYGSLDALNDNFDQLETAIDNTLSRDGTGPNSMEAPLDMGGNPILNASVVNAGALILGGISVEPGESLSEASTVQVWEFTSTEGQSSFSISPLNPVSTAVQLEVDGFSLPPSSLSVSGSVVNFPPLAANRQVVLRVFTREIGGIPAITNADVASSAAISSNKIAFGSRTLTSKLNELPSVLDNGADPTGVNNSTAAFNASTSIPVIIPPGNYRTDTVPTGPTAAIVLGAAFTGASPWDSWIPAFGVSAVEVVTTGLRNAVIGVARNNAPAGTLGFPTGVTGYGRNDNAGNTAFGIYAEGRQFATSGCVVGAELDSFNMTGTAPTNTTVPDRSIGTTQQLPNAVTIGAGGTANSWCGTHFVREGSSPQSFLYGAIFDANAVVESAIVVEASPGVGPTLPMLVKHKVASIAAQFQGVGTPVGSNAWLQYVDGSSVVQQSFKQDGSIEVRGNKVLGVRATGWSAATGTATRTSFATSTVTTEQLAQRVKALIDDLISHGLIGA